MRGTQAASRRMQLAQWLLLATHSATLRVHVAPPGAAAGDAASPADGSAEWPFARLHDAQAHVRSVLDAAAGGAAHIEVQLASGSYELTEPLVFTERDGGRGGRRVIWRGPAESDGEARVLGGSLVGGWERACECAALFSAAG